MRIAAPTREQLSSVRRTLRATRTTAYHDTSEEPMNGLDILICLEAADHADKFRGWRWVDTFGRVARQLGYHRIPGIATHLEHCRYGL